MNKHLLLFLLVYFVLISLTASVVTLIDKSRAERGGWRTPEKTLLLLGLFGGALSEYITMKRIRHKTLHKKFMIGLPLMIAFHVFVIIFSIYEFAIKDIF